MTNLEKKLFDYGYKNSKVPITNKYADRFFQKRIVDKKNNRTMFFINCFIYLSDSMIIEDRAEFGIYFNNNDYSCYITMYGFNDKDIDLFMVESDSIDLYKTIRGNYYE